MTKKTEKYKITLQKLPNVVLYTYMLPENATDEEIANSFDILVTNMDFVTYKNNKLNGLCSGIRWQNGYIVFTRTKQIDKTQSSIHEWKRVQDIFGKTPEEAFNACIAYHERLLVRQTGIAE